MNDTGSLHISVMGVTAIVVLCFLFALVRIINSTENDLEWSHLISTRSVNGTYADWNKIGQGLGVVLCTWLPAVYVYSPKMDAAGLALVMGVALAYLGGVSGYAATLRSKQGSVETKRVTESNIDKTVTDTKVETK